MEQIVTKLQSEASKVVFIIPFLNYDTREESWLPTSPTTSRITQIQFLQKSICAVNTNAVSFILPPRAFRVRA